MFRSKIPPIERGRWKSQKTSRSHFMRHKRSTPARLGLHEAQKYVTFIEFKKENRKLTKFLEAVEAKPLSFRDNNISPPL